jgi:hypothetical protein
MFNLFEETQEWAEQYVYQIYEQAMEQDKNDDKDEKHDERPIVEYSFSYFNYDKNNYIGETGAGRVIEKPDFHWLGIYNSFNYSLYVVYWGLPVALFFNVFFGPWKIFRASMLWTSGLGTFTDILTITETKIKAFWVNIYLLLWIPTWLMIQLFGVPLELTWILS